MKKIICISIIVITCTIYSQMSIESAGPISMKEVELEYEVLYKDNLDSYLSKINERYKKNKDLNSIYENFNILTKYLIIYNHPKKREKLKNFTKFFINDINKYEYKTFRDSKLHFTYSLMGDFDKARQFYDNMQNNDNFPMYGFDKDFSKAGWMLRYYCLEYVYNYPKEIRDYKPIIYNYSTYYKKQDETKCWFDEFYFYLLILSKNKELLINFFEVEMSRPSIIFPNKEKAVIMKSIILKMECLKNDSEYRKYILDNIEKVIVSKQSCKYLNMRGTACFKGEVNENDNNSNNSLILTD